MKDIIAYITKNGWSFIDSLRNNKDNINTIQKLKKENPNIPINDILSLIKLQNSARKKLLNPERFIFSRKALEQSSSQVIAKFHAKKFLEIQKFADLCCGSGMDFHYLAKGKEKSYAVDLDPETLEMAKFNSQGIKNCEFVNCGAEEFNEKVEAIFIDPDRRINGVRRIEVEDLSPSWDSVKSIINKYKNVVVKLSPAMNYEKLELSCEHTLEFVSENRNLKEILICTGCFATKEVKYKAILLPNYIEFSDNYPLSEEISDLKTYLYEPDPALIRAHLIKHLAGSFNFTRIHAKLAILTSNCKIENIFFQRFEVEEVMHFKKKQINSYIKQNKIGRLDIKTRGFSETVEDFRKKLKLKGKIHKVLFILRFDRHHLAVFTKPQTSSKLKV